ncbi:Ig-like domain-containing protein, partial [Nocardioides sp.]|uniref:Ig-like domain-containing protein n=1 Tax=Nocardioides sp. TaxID=35761 RepID=UPI0031FE5CCD|nr:Alpha-L-rhamnosidase N-terminal protein [Nocardioides sp.]
KIKAGRQVKVAAVVSAPGASPTGRAEFVVDGKVLKTVALSAGKATASVVIRGRGKHTVVVRYLGSPTVAASVSAPRTIKAT